MKGTQVQIQRDIESLQSQTKKNESSISKLKEALDVKLEVLTGELYETNTRIDRIENDITKYAKEIDDSNERLLSLEIYSRDCIQTSRTPTELGLKDDGTPRPILAKFLYRPEWFRVIIKKSELCNGVRVSIV